MATPVSGPPPENRAGDDAGIFQHVLVGIDETPESVVAAAQARVLRAPGGRLELLGVAETYLAAHAGAGAFVADETLHAGTELELERARELVEPDSARVVSGRLVDALCSECGRSHASLVAVGVRRHGRLGALTFGGHDVEVLHDAPCSVLISRPGWGPSKPERVVVGVDRSPAARAAEAVARSLAARIGCDVLSVVALGDDVDLALLRDEREDALLDPRGLVEAVAATARLSDLVVVGREQRRPHARRADVAERVVHAARCSVLVVRQAAA